MSASPVLLHPDCKFFRGDIPCSPHKQYGVHCDGCTFYAPQNKKILVIKLGAIGDVIRTTPLLHKIREEYPTAAVWWLTRSPEMVPSSVEKILPFTLESILLLQNTEFDILLNLDKDPEACALAVQIDAHRKRGFILRDGKPAPVDHEAEHKYMTGLFDDLNKANTKSYPEEIFEICGWTFQGEEYILELKNNREWSIPNEGKPIVGLNTGCGGRWTSRLWAEDRWEQLIRRLQQDGCFPMLLGGEQEHEKNQRLAAATGAFYPGYSSLQDFTSLVNRCDVVVTAVTMAMHLAIGLKKPLILFVNIFNPHEFELYGRGEILVPDKPCTCFFQATCTNPAYKCMENLEVESVVSAVERAITVHP